MTKLFKPTSLVEGTPGSIGDMINPEGGLQDADLQKTATSWGFEMMLILGTVLLMVVFISTFIRAIQQATSTEGYMQKFLSDIGGKYAVVAITFLTPMLLIMLMKVLGLDLTAYLIS